MRIKAKLLWVCIITLRVTIHGQSQNQPKRTRVSRHGCPPGSADGVHQLSEGVRKRTVLLVEWGHVEKERLRNNWVYWQPATDGFAVSCIHTHP